MRVVDGKVKLSARERSAFFAGNWPELADQGKPPELTERHYALSSRLSFTVRGIHRTKKGYRLEYDVVDDREERFHLLPASASFPTDERGQPLADMPPEEEIGYTRNPKRRVVDDLPTVRPDTQKVLAMRSRLSRAQTDSRQEEMFERQCKNFANAIRGMGREAAKSGVDAGTLLAPLLKEYEARLAEEMNEGEEAA